MLRTAFSPIKAGRRAYSTVVASAMQPSEVIDLVSPTVQGKGRSGRGRSSGVSVIDLTLPSPPPPALAAALDSSPGPEEGAAGGEVIATKPKRRSRTPSGGAPRAALIAPRPPRFLSTSGYAADLRKRGLLPMGADGQPLCRWCKGEVQPPKARVEGRYSLRGVGRGLVCVPVRVGWAFVSECRSLVVVKDSLLCLLCSPAQQKTFCSPACVHEHLVRSNPTYAREVRLGGVGPVLEA
jgi:hypothetical protein